VKVNENALLFSDSPNQESALPSALAEPNCLPVSTGFPRPKTTAVFRVPCIGEEICLGGLEKGMPSDQLRRLGGGAVTLAICSTSVATSVCERGIPDRDVVAISDEDHLK
jgi:hypothetical protein